MKRAKLRLEQVWPELGAGAKPRHKAENAKPGRSEEASAEPGELRLVSSQPTARPAKPKGSYCLRRGWSMVVRSVYLTRVLERLEQGYRDNGERFFSNLALIWVSRDGSREYALKGRALRELVLGKP